VTRRARPEDSIQRAVFEHLRVRGAPGVFAFHPPNGGKHNRTEAAIFRGLGARPGVPDVIAIPQGRCFAIELKTGTGHLTQAQKNAIADLERAGTKTAVCRGLNAALHTLEQRGLLRVGRWWAEQAGAERPFSELQSCPADIASSGG
jgi:VRR-NUC domain